MPDISTLTVDGVLYNLKDAVARQDIAGLEATVEDVQGDIQSLIAAVGTPLVASTAAQMVDTLKIYVYTGSETGYNTGHWYYWNSAASPAVWADGGNYNSTGFETDKQLKVPNMAADAEATGGAIDELNNLLEAVASGIYATEDYKTRYALGEYITLSVGVGNTVSLTPTANTNYGFIVIPCKKGDTFTITGKGGASARLWAFTDTAYKLISVSAANLSGTNLVLTAEQSGYFMSNVEYKNVLGYALTVWHEVVNKDYIEKYNALTVTPGVDVTVSGVTVAYGSENELRIYGTPTQTGYFSRFNGIITGSNSGSLSPSKTVPSGTYTFYWDNPAVRFYRTEGTYNDCVVINSGEPFTADNDFAVCVQTAVVDGSYGTSADPTVCKFTLFDGSVDGGVLLSLNTAIDAMARSMVKSMANAKADRGYYSLNRLLNTDGGYIDTNVQVGTAIDYTVIPNSSFGCMVIPVSKNDEFKISGSGGLASRLWAFADTNDKLISKSQANLGVDNLILVAPADGKLIINVTITVYTNHVADVQKRIIDTTDLYENTLAQAEYDYRHVGFDILSAFSNVTCCGDSLTASVVYTHDNGDGTHRTRSAYKKYPWILGQKIGAEAESVASGGYSATDWWNAFSNRIVQKENHLVIIYLGTNGGLTDTVSTDAPGTDYTQYANTNTGNYCKMVAKALEVGAKVLLIKIHQGGGGNIYTTNDVIDQIATKFTVAVVDVPFLSSRRYHAFPDNTGVNTLHYNDLGYAAFADSLIRSVGYLSDDMAVRLIPA